MSGWVNLDPTRRVVSSLVERRRYSVVTAYANEAEAVTNVQAKSIGYMLIIMAFGRMTAMGGKRSLGKHRSRYEGR